MFDKLKFLFSPFPMKGPIIAAIAVVVAVIATLKMGGDNPIENYADSVIEKEIGIKVDISDILGVKK